MTDPQPTPPPAAPYAPAPAAPQDRYNVLSIVGFILSFFIAVAGIIISFIALSQIRRTGEKGHGLALAGVIVGFVIVALYILYFIVVGIAIGNAASTGSLSQ